jgi:CBS domain-containing protein
MLYKAAGQSAVPLVTSGAASVRYASNTQRMRKALAGDVRCAMTTAPLVTISPQASVQEAAALLIRHKVSRLPVIDPKDGLVGILSTADVMQVVTADANGCDAHF